MEIRRATPEDRDASYAMFRSSIWDHLVRTGSVGPDDTDDLAAAWDRQGALWIHLEETAAEDWVAEAPDGSIVGMARSIERSGHLQLTHFFVDPTTQSAGLGRALLDRAFPPGRGVSRSVIATQHPSALGLYLRYGVSVQSVGMALYGTPAAQPPRSDLEFRPATAADLEAMAAIDAGAVGFDRGVDLAFFLTERPGHLVLRDGEVVGYAFTSNGLSAGPAAVLDSADLAAVMAHTVDASAQRGDGTVFFAVSAQAAHAVGWALEHGFRIFPFYEMLLSDRPHVDFDRYLLTQPAFIW